MRSSRFHGATHAPVRFGSEAFIRVGSLTKKLKDYPTKEAELWATFSKKPFETGIAKADLLRGVLPCSTSTGALNCFNILTSH